MKKEIKEAEMEKKMKNLNFIKQFSKIQIADICRQLNINIGNLWCGRTSKINVQRVKEKIIEEINKLEKGE